MCANVVVSIEKDSKQPVFAHSSSFSTYLTAPRHMDILFVGWDYSRKRAALRLLSSEPQMLVFQQDTSVVMTVPCVLDKHNVAGLTILRPNRSSKLL